MRDSRLFCSYIAAKQRDDWVGSWDEDPRAIEADIVKNFVRETHNLAERANAKYRHTFEASWLFVLALMFLGTSILLRTLSSFYDKGEVVELKTRHLVVLAAIVVVHAGVQIYTRVVHDLGSIQRAHDFDAYSRRQLYSAQVARRAESASRKPQAEVYPVEAGPLTLGVTRNAALYQQGRYTWTWIIAVVGFSLPLALPVDSWPRTTESLVLVSGAVAVVLPVWITRDRWDDRSSTRSSSYSWAVLWKPFVIWSVAGAVAGVALGMDGLPRVAAILLPAILLSLLGMAGPGLSQWRTRQRFLGGRLTWRHRQRRRRL